MTYSRTIHRQMPMAYEDSLLLHILAAWGGGEVHTERLKWNVTPIQTQITEEARVL